MQRLSCLADATIEFLGGLTAIVGGNGVGKSTLVAAIAELLAADASLVENSYGARLRGSSNDGIAFSLEKELRLSRRDGGTDRLGSGDAFEGECRWLDPSALAGRLLFQLNQDTNFGDLLDSLTPVELAAEEINVASYLVGKNYTSIRIFEITDYAEFDRFPYFQVSSAGTTYGCQGMGKGELSLLLAYWTLTDLPKNSILILEEPETHVSPKSQDALMNIVAKCCDERGVWVVVTTHSPTVIRRINPANIVFLARDDGPTKQIVSASKLDMTMLLGGGVAYKCVILVEDEVAKSFVLTLLEILDTDLYRQCEVANAGSKENILSILTAMPRTRSWLTIVGAFDGDQRSALAEKVYPWPHCFLPGDSNPEHILASFMGSGNAVDLMATELHTLQDTIKVALNHVAGMDPHDYFREFSAAVNRDIQTVRRAFVHIWLTNGESRLAAEKLIENFRSGIDS